MRKIIPKNATLVPEEAKCVFEGKIYSIYQWQQKMFDGSFETFEMLKRPDTVKVLAIKDDKLVLLKQEQPNSRGYFYDLPGGRHDVASETELAAAKRELLEETGMSFKDWRLIDVSQPHGKVEQFIYVFMATNFESQIKQNLDAGEKIEIQLIELKELKELTSDPKARYLPKEILDKVNSLEELTNLEHYTGESLES